ncbi:MAG TPA: branched-chain amino acid ABC transporter ATP-binding protein/permease [Magnetospirillaceae bacterium]|jgi:branched-chain amino acid transport system permease protein
MSGRRMIALVVAALFLVLPLLSIVPEFWVALLDYIGIGALIAVGLVLLTGVGGMTSFGQAAFVGFGAYTTGVLTTHYGVSPWLALPAAVIVTGVAALILGSFTVRLSGHYLPLGTIAWGISAFYVFGNLQILGGHDGITNIPPLSLGGHALTGVRPYWVVVWVAVILAVIATQNLLDSRLGRAIRALRQGAVAAESFGVEIARTKLIVFVFAAVLAGIAGWLYAHFQRSLGASAFGVSGGIDYLLMAVMGGTGQVYGALIGAGLVTVLRDVLQDWLPHLFGASGNYEDLAFGILLIAILQGAREGLWPMIARLFPAPKPRAVIAEVPTPAVQAAAKSTGPLLTLDTVRKRFGGLVAVNGVSFTVGTGEIVALIGPNGAGKSTLFNAVTGIAPADEGRVLLGDAPIQGDSPQNIARRGIGRTFQHVKLIPELTVLENVALGAHLHSRAGLVEAVLRLDRAEERKLFAAAAAQLKRVGMADNMHRTAGQLALGQMRVVEIARALCLNPSLLLLDEPAAGLRLKEKQALAEVLRGLRAEGMSVLVVEHDMDFVMGLADRIVVLDFGEKIAEGAPAVVRANPAVIEAYLGGVA